MGIDRVAVVAALGLGGFAGLTGCGDDSASGRVDAGDPGDGSGSGSDGSMQLGCDYTEMADATNGLLANAEASSLTVGASPIAICGAIDTGHYDSSLEVVDGDFFSFTLASEADLIVHVTGAGLTTPQQVLMQINQQGSFSFFGFGAVEGDHGTIATHLSPGTYTIAIGAVHPQDLVAPIAYRVSIGPDAPATRCPASTGTPTTEGSDGGANDVIEYYASGNPNSRLTTSTSDAPETTGITAAAGASYRITGTAANTDPADDYMDRDTFAFATGPSTNQLTVRLNWTASVDFDYRVFPVVPANTDPLSIAAGLSAAQSEDELETFAVKPNTTYWLWVAAEDGSTLPADYSATICGETFTP